MTGENQPIRTKQRWINLTLVALVSQVGCLTLVIILAALLAGMYLDNNLGTKPWWTLGLILGSIPVSLVIMFFVSRTALRRMKPERPDHINRQMEEGIGDQS